MGGGAGVQHVSAQEPVEEATRVRLNNMWPAGSKCTIHGLQSAAGQQLNGCSAEVQSIDEKTGRLLLQMDPGDEMDKWKKVKPENARWDGVEVELMAVGENAIFVEETCALIRGAAGSPGAVESLVIEKLNANLTESQRKLPFEDFRRLLSFAEQARSHASQWLFYHELRVKPDMKFEGPNGMLSMADTTRKQAAEEAAATVKKAYWDTAREQLARPTPDFSFVGPRVEELVQTMASFLPVARRDAFKEHAVDLSMLRNQLDNGAFDYKSLSDLVQRLGKVLMELESPFQSARTKEWLDDLVALAEPDDANFRRLIVDWLAHLSERCDVLRVEIENCGLELIRMTKLQDMERDVFAEMIKSGILDGHVTKKWLAASEHGGHVEVGVIRGIGRLLTEKAAISHETCPEPLRCDLQKLHTFQSGLQGVALLGLVAIVFTPFFPSGMGAEDAKPLFEAVASEINQDTPKLERICEFVEQGISDLRHEKGAEVVDFTKFDAALGTLKKCLGEDVPAFRLLHDRATKAFVATLGPPKREVVDNCLGEAPWSLKYAEQHLNKLVDDVWTFIGEHLRVYKPVYSELL